MSVAHDTVVALQTVSATLIIPTAFILFAFSIASCAYQRYPPIAMMISTNGNGVGFTVWITGFYAWLVATIVIITQEHQWLYENESINKWFMVGIVGNCICPFIWAVFAFTTTLGQDETTGLLPLKVTLGILAHRFVLIAWLASTVLIATHTEFIIRPIITHIAILQLLTFTGYMATLWELFFIRWTVFTNDRETNYF